MNTTTAGNKASVIIELMCNKSSSMQPSVCFALVVGDNNVWTACSFLSGNIVATSWVCICSLFLYHYCFRWSCLHKAIIPSFLVVKFVYYNIFSLSACNQGNLCMTRLHPVKANMSPCSLYCVSMLINCDLPSWLASILLPLILFMVKLTI